MWFAQCVVWVNTTLLELRTLGHGTVVAFADVLCSLYMRSICRAKIPSRLLLSDPRGGVWVLGRPWPTHPTHQNKNNFPQQKNEIY